MEDKKIQGMHSLIMENRAKLNLTGVKDIHSFDDEVVLVETELGILTIKGLDLKMNKLNLDNSELCIEGKIIALVYSENEIGKKIQTIGAEFGVTTGRARRCGWFDAVIAKYAALVSGLTGIALTKADVFDTFEEIKVCVAYKDTRDGKVYEYYPTNVNIHKYLEPVYETHAGWMEDITNCKTYDELPQNAKKYLARLEELIGVKITIISVGPNREQTIILENPLV